MKKQTTTGADCSLIRPILLLILPFLPTLGPWGLLPVQAQQAAPPYPDVTKMIRESFDDYLDGTVACGREALRHRMRGYIYQGNPGRLDAPKLTQFERLLVDDPEDVAAVNREIVAYCQHKTAEIEAAWRDPQRRHPAKEVCAYQTELIPWMKRYPKLPGIPDARPDPVLGEMVNYQTDQYALGSINHPYEASGCMAYASAWWNDSRARAEAPLGSPKRFAALYQDNYVGETSAGITDEQWVKARSGFVVEMGDATEYGSFERFRDVMLKAEVKETSDGFIRRIQYQRPGRNLEMTWHCYEEDYLTRRINGRDHRTLRHLQCPEFAVGECELRTHDARLTTRAGETAWLLSAAPSRTYVAYQPNPHRQLPITLETPIGRIEAERFPFGKLVASRTANNTLELHIDVGFRPFWSSVHWRAQIWQDLGTHPGDILIQTDATEVTAVINGDKMPVMRERRNDQVVWILDPYARLPRVRDRSTVTVIPRSRSWLAHQAFEHECNDRHSSCKALHSK